MNNRTDHQPAIVIALIIFTGFSAAVRTEAQRISGADDLKTPSPTSEKFVKADGLAVPWRETGCVAVDKSIDPECHSLSREDYDATSRMTLFNSNGTVWYRFSISHLDDDHFVQQKNPAFVPFAVVGYNTGVTTPNGAVLRVVGISPNWYEVEINEKNQKTKFISRKDRSWATVTWEYWWHSDPRITIDPTRTKLYDKPNGSIVAVGGLKAFSFRQLAGDWAKVRGSYGGLNEFYVWLRWRNGRKILVGCVFNSFEVPDEREAQFRIPEPVLPPLAPRSN